MSSKTTSHDAAHCPRCGYDLHGSVDTWTVSCPLRGTCVECGLEFAWVDVLRPDLGEPLWCVEMHMGRWPLLGGAWETLKRSWLPWLFWTRLQMHHPIRRDRLMNYVALLVLITAGLYTTQQTIVAVRTHSTIARVFDRSLNRSMTTAQRLRDSMELRFADATESVRQAEVRRLALKERDELDAHVLDHSMMAAILESVFQPMSARSSSVVQLPDVRMPYPAPIARYGLLERLSIELDMNKADLFGAPPGQRRRVRGGVITGSPSSRSSESGPNVMALIANSTSNSWLMTELLLFLAVPIGFVLLPFSRRQAKVRWRHIARVAAYSLWIPAVLLSFAFATGVISYGMLTAEAPLDAMARTILVVLSVPLTYFWWGFAVARYLKMPTPWLIVSVLMGLALMVATLIAVISPTGARLYHDLLL